jgi:hypothetical protein
MRDKLEWEKEMRMVYRHHICRSRHTSWHIRISKEIALEIENYSASRINIDVSRNDLTWQGMPMRVDPTLAPGCFVFDEGEIV